MALIRPISNGSLNMHISARINVGSTTYSINVSDKKYIIFGDFNTGNVMPISAIYDVENDSWIDSVNIATGTGSHYSSVTRNGNNLSIIFTNSISYFRYCYID